MNKSIKEIENELAEYKKKIKELENKCKSCANQKTFEYLNSRIHTRESSTLVFSTVAVSASLILLGILIGLENPFNILSYLDLSSITIIDIINIMTFHKIYQNSNNWISLIGISVIILGILYREITILTIEDEDYYTLKHKCGVKLDKLSKKSRTTRSIIVKIFFFTVLDAWIIYEYFPISNLPFHFCHGLFLDEPSLFLIKNIIFILVFPVVLTTIYRFYLNYKKSQREKEKNKQKPTTKLATKKRTEQKLTKK